MSGKFGGLVATWQRLTARDRRILAAALPVVLILLVYVVLVAPLQRQHQTALSELAQHKQDYHWLQQQPGSVSGGKACPSNNTAVAGAGDDYWRSRAVQLGIRQLEIVSVGSNEWEARASAVPAQAVLQLLNEMVCHGITPLAVSINLVGGDGAVDVELRLLDPQGNTPSDASAVRSALPLTADPWGYRVNLTRQVPLIGVMKSAMPQQSWRQVLSA